MAHIRAFLIAVSIVPEHSASGQQVAKQSGRDETMCAEQPNLVTVEYLEVALGEQRYVFRRRSHKLRMAECLIWIFAFRNTICKAS
jgi:hypothetical protein